MSKVATRDLAVEIDDYYEVGGLRYTLKGKNPLRFVASRPTTDLPSVTTTDLTDGTNETAGLISAKVVKDAIGAAIETITIPGWLDDVATIENRDALTNVKAGNRIRVLDAGDSKWAAFEARGDSPNPNWFQLADEDNLNSPLSTLSDTDAIAGTATTSSLISAATLKAATSAAALWPTIQASLDKDVTIASGTAPSLIHLNTAKKPDDSAWTTTWDVSKSVDGEHHVVQSFGLERTINITGATSIFVDGVITTGTGVVIAAKTHAIATCTLNNDKRFVNILTNAPTSASGVAPPIFVATANNIDGASGYVMTTVTNTIGATNNGAAGIALPVGRYRISLTGQKSTNAGEHRSRIFNAAGQTLGRFYVAANQSESAAFDYQVTAANDFIRITRDFSSGNGSADNLVLTITRVDRLFIVDSQSRVLMPRRITGDGITSAIGYDNVPVPVRVEIPPGTMLATVAPVNRATIANATAGIINVTPSGADVAVTWTTAPNRTYTGLQRLGVDTSINFVSDNASITTDLDFTNADWAVVRVNESKDRKSTFWLRLDPAAATEQHALWMYDTWYGELNIIDKAAGTVSFYDGNVSLKVDLIETWSNAANGFVTPTGNTVLTRRTISGAISGVGYDGVTLAYSYALPTGQRIASVTATGGATAENTNPSAGVVTITPNGADTAITITTEPNRTYTGLQRLGEYRVAPVDIEGGTLTATGLNLTLADKLQVTLQHGDAGSFQSSGTVNPTYSDFVIDLVQLRGTANGYAHLPLESGYIQMRVMNFATGDIRWEDQSQKAQFVAASAWVEAANGYFVPEGTVLATPRTITATLDGATTTVNGEASIIRAEGSTILVQLPLTRDRRLTAVSGGGTIEVAESGIIRVNVGATNIALVATSAIYLRNVTANVLINGGASATAQVGVPSLIHLAVPGGQQITAIAAINGVARSIGGFGPVEVIPSGSADMVIAVTLSATTPRVLSRTENSGAWIAFGTIEVQMAPSGNRSMRIRSASGAIDIRWLSWITWDTNSGWSTATLTTSSEQYLLGRNFGGAGQLQFATIQDTTSGRVYRVTMQVGAAYNSNIFWFEELT
jgi:hypothetical protein